MSTETKYSKENYIDKIKGLLDMNTENGCTESEAQTAMLMAQKLMAKHGIEMSDIEVEAETKKEVIQGYAEETKRNSWFEPQLAMVVGDNFRCHVFLQNGTKIVFLGLKEDVEIAKMVFKFASIQALHHARIYRKDRKKRLLKESNLPDFSKMDHTDVVVYALSLEELERHEVMDIMSKHHEQPDVKKRVLVSLIKKRLGLSGDGAEIRNTYLKGFLEGLRTAFEKQKEDMGSEFGLVLVKDKEVEDAYGDLSLRQGRARSVRSKADAETFAAGRKQGESFKTISGELN